MIPCEPPAVVPRVPRGGGRCLAAAAVGAALALAACAAPGDRGYYAPVGLPLGPTIATYREESADSILDVRCQGVYVNTVDGAEVGTVHVQLEMARPRSGELVFPRGELLVEVPADGERPRMTLSPVEIWTGRVEVPGDPAVASWSRRPFDVFFDAPELTAERPPEALLLRWVTRSGGERHVGQCLFRRLPAEDPRAPSETPIADVAFGLRDGYYLPGHIHLGARGLQPSGEERMHYVFHSPGRWPW